LKAQRRRTNTAVPVGITTDGLGLGEGEGDGEGLGEGLGEGERWGLGVGVGEGTWPFEPLVYPVKEGWTKFATGIPAVAWIMKLWKISAGIVPPYTALTPSTPTSGISFFGYPTQTHVTS